MRIPGSVRTAVGHENAATTDGYGTHILALERSPVYEVAKAFAPERSEP